MANSDYELLGTGEVTPSCDLLTGMTEGSIGIAVGNFTAPEGVVPTVGQGVMVGDEIMRLTEVNMPYLRVARGCADTIPAVHAFGEKMWFISTVGGDAREYIANETIGVKVLMKATGGVVPIKSAPPNQLTFNHRFARPYPPGLVLIDGLPWWAQTNFLDNDRLSFNLTWTHRDRVLQDDTLQGHEMGNIGPEIGTTYTIEILDSTGAVRATHQVLEGNTFNYHMNQVRIDLGLSPNVGVVEGSMRLYSKRGIHTSLQPYVIQFTANVNEVPTGWGNGWGNAWGQ